MPNDKWVEGYKKHQDEWNRYAKRMNRMDVDQIEHDFNGAYETCQRCGTHRDTIMSGMASWLCNMRTMPCCSKEGLETWDHQKMNWFCSQCKSITSTDHAYTSWGWHSTTKTDDAPKKCTCDIVNLMQKGCACGGT